MKRFRLLLAAPLIGAALAYAAFCLARCPAALDAAPSPLARIQGTGKVDRFPLELVLSRLMTSQSPVVRRAAVCYALGEFERCAAIMADGIQGRTPSRDDLLLLACAEYRMGSPSGTDRLDDAVRACPRHVDLLEARASIRIRRSEHLSAEQDLTTILSVSPLAGQARVALALLMSRRGADAEADRLLEEGLSVPMTASSDRWTCAGYVTCALVSRYQLAGRIDESIRICRQYLERFKADRRLEDTRVEYRLASLLALQGELDEAEKFARLALAPPAAARARPGILPPEFEAKSRLVLANILLQRNNVAEAVKLYREVSNASNDAGQKAREVLNSLEPRRQPRLN